MCNTTIFTRAAGALVSLALAGACSAAGAADLPTKAPPLVAAPPPPALDIHGFADLSFKNDYMTPRGLLVTNTGLTIQHLAGLVFDAYKDRAGFINNVSFTVGIWNDIWTDGNNPTAGAWKEFDWFVGMNIAFAQNWRFGVQFIQFLSPPGDFKAESNVEFVLAYDDSTWGLPVVFNPYVKFWYAAAGDSNVVVGKRGDTGYVEFGITPTLDLTKQGYPVVFMVPTWISVGPEEYWNGGVGILHCVTCSASNFGVFSTGLTAKVPLNFVPPNYGRWYVTAGGQYYHLINDNLLYAQNFTLGLPFLPGVISPGAHRDVGVGFASLGFTF
jgi:hypothetical protein